MRYNKIDSQLFNNNRKRLFKLLPENSMAILNSNDIMPTNADGTFPFKQNSDIFYLSGIDQEETILLLIKKESIQTSYLFIKETSPSIAIWEGEKHSQEEAQSISGIEKVAWLDTYKNIIGQYSSLEIILLNSNEHLRSSTPVESRDQRFRHWIKKNYPETAINKLAPLLHQLRVIKNGTEIGLLQSACDITHKGFMELIPSVKPGIKEYELEASFSQSILREGSRGFAYQPIIASGKNATILHYINNDKSCRKGDLILLDIGAEYANYNGDLTRVLPVSGRFNQRQAAIYNAVLRIQKIAIKYLKPGILLSDYRKHINELMEKELVDLDLISLEDIREQRKASPAFRKYFMHGVSHFLGLAVHDVGDLNSTVEEGMVLTVEPGIYIPEESIGIRLENDIVIQKGGNLDLMANTPIEIEEIESLMNT